MVQDPVVYCTRMLQYAFALILLSSWAVGEDHFKFEYANNSYTLINVTGKATDGLCKNGQPVNAYASNQDIFISSNLRFDLCQMSYAKIGKDFKTDHQKCFKDDGHILTLYNPCYIVCSENAKPTDGNSCDDSDPSETQFLLTNHQCGKNHFCDSYGCCLEKQKFIDDTTTTEKVTLEPDTPETTTPLVITTKMTTQTPNTPQTITSSVNTTETSPETTTPLPNTPQTPPTTPDTANTTTPEPTTVTTTVTLTTPKSNPKKPYPTKKHICNRPGYELFKKNPRFYYFCRIYGSVHSCGKDKKFSSHMGACTYDPNSPDPALEFALWKDSLLCPKYGVWLRSPYDCKYFYMCQVGHPILFNYCYGGLVFNESSQSCEHKTSRCNNRLMISKRDKQ